MTKTLIAALLIASPLLAEEGDAAPSVDKRTQKYIARKDANGDGKLSADELGVERPIFAALDKNGDGFVTADELVAPRKARKARKDRARPKGQDRGNFAARFIERHDKDKDGKVAKSEFPQGGRIDFAKADGNGDGFLDKAEVGKLFQRAGKAAKKGGKDAQGRARKAMTPEQMRELAGRTMKRFDKNGDGKLTPEELPKPKKGKDGKGKARGGLDFASADKNKDGAVDLFELTLVITDTRKAAAQKQRGDPRMLLRMVERMDANKDGKVSKDEWKGRPQMFAKLDTNKDGAIAKAEVEAILKKTQRWRGRAGESMFRRMDANKDGRISKDEWKLDADFAKFDRNKDGFISADEVMLFSKKRSRGPKPDARSGKSSAHFLQKYDKNRDGSVGKAEFPHERRFAEIDADGNGVLSKAEIEEAMDKKLRESNVGFFERFDLNGDGKVTRGEFTGPAADFESKDRNNDGVIDKADKPDKR